MIKSKSVMSFLYEKEKKNSGATIQTLTKGPKHGQYLKYSLFGQITLKIVDVITAIIKNSDIETLKLTFFVRLSKNLLKAVSQKDLCNLQLLLCVQFFCIL